MCTLSFLPDAQGYFVAMNRDESRRRVPAYPPAIYRTGELTALYPREPSGGTWVGVNSRGIVFGLLNWYSMDVRKLDAKLHSRGEIIPQTLPAETLGAADWAVRGLDLIGVHPFRLIGIFPDERKVMEWRWDGERLIKRWHPWARKHWYSSSWSDSRAEAVRGKAAERTWDDNEEEPIVWLRHLHSSHIPEPGPFSVCVHRDDAATVSYTEIHCSPEQIQMLYFPGNPCHTSHLPPPLIIPFEHPHHAAR